MKREENSQLVVIAGPNGAGKSTLSSTAYPKLIENTVFINPDEIVKNVAIDHPDKSFAHHQLLAARTALKSYQTCFKHNQSFSMETTLVGYRALHTMRKAREKI